jgi:hypothetical protein
MIVPVFLPFSQIDQVSLRIVSADPDILHQVTIFAGRQNSTQIVIDDTLLNPLLPALYTLSPNLRSETTPLPPNVPPAQWECGRPARILIQYEQL